MFDFFFPSEPFGSQTLRLVAEAGEGGGDAFEIARVCRDIELGDKDGWERAWIEKAEETAARKEMEKFKAGQTVGSAALLTTRIMAGAGR